MAIVVTREGLSTAVIDLSGNQVDFYQPEEDVLFSYVGRTVAGTEKVIKIDVKGQRKLKPGDQIVALFLGATATTVIINGVLTVLVKQ